MTVAFELKIPLPWKRDGFLKSRPREWSDYHLATIWHVDPERGPGGDDSCGWFMRAHHGDQAVLAKIIKRFNQDWDRVWLDREEDSTGEPKGPIKGTYFRGYFCPNGEPHFSTQGIVLNLFFDAACEHFKSDGLSNFKRARRFMQDNLFDILLFAENPVDSLHDSLVRTFGGETKREERIEHMASCIYGWILRRQRPWYRHPRWHIWHWKLQIHPLQNLWHWLTRRCSKCGGRFRYRESPIGNWAGTEVWHEHCYPQKPSIQK